MNRLLHQSLLFVIAASLLLAACSKSTPVPTTAIQEPATLAPATPTAIPPTNTPLPSATQPPTSTPLPTIASTPTASPAPSATLQPVSTLVETPSGASTSITAHVEQNTNCRSGPSSVYTLIAEILAGEDVKVISATTIQDYVIIETPQDPAKSCWLWTKYVTLSSDLSGLPVATPPPYPITFSLAYSKLQNCNGHVLEFKVVNTGTTTLQSYTLVAKDLDENTQQTSTSTVFSERSGCSVEDEISYIDPGKSGFAYAAAFPYDPTGHYMEATMTVCSHDDGTGICVSFVTRFTP